MLKPSNGTNRERKVHTMVEARSVKRSDTGMQGVVKQRDTHARQTISNEVIAECQNLGRSSRGRKKLARILHAVKKRNSRLKLERKKRLADIRAQDARYIRGH